MAITGPIPGIDLAGEAIAAVVSFFLTYYAHKAYKLSGQRSLFLLSFGFLLIGFGLISQSIALLIGAFIPAGTEVTSPLLRGLVRLLVLAVGIGSIIHWVLEIVGYSTIFIAYLYQTRSSATSEMRPLGLIALQTVPTTVARIIFRPELELVTFLIILFILLEVIILFIPVHHFSTLLVILGFLFLSLAHLAFLLFVFFADTSIYVYALGHALQLAGFLLLLVMLLRTTRGK